MLLGLTIGPVTSAVITNAPKRRPKCPPARTVSTSLCDQHPANAGDPLKDSSPSVHVGLSDSQRLGEMVVEGEEGGLVHGHCGLLSLRSHWVAWGMLDLTADPGHETSAVARPKANEPAMPARQARSRFSCVRSRVG